MTTKRRVGSLLPHRGGGLTSLYRRCRRGRCGIRALVMSIRDRSMERYRISMDHVRNAMIVWTDQNDRVTPFLRWGRARPPPGPDCDTPECVQPGDRKLYSAADPASAGPGGSITPPVAVDAVLFTSTPKCRSAPIISDATRAKKSGIDD